MDTSENMRQNRWMIRGAVQMLKIYFSIVKIINYIPSLVYDEKRVYELVSVWSCNYVIWLWSVTTVCFCTSKGHLSSRLDSCLASTLVFLCCKASFIFLFLFSLFPLLLVQDCFCLQSYLCSHCIRSRMGYKKVSCLPYRGVLVPDHLNSDFSGTSHRPVYLYIYWHDHE